jgi:phospholipase/carboxylesterase
MSALSIAQRLAPDDALLILPESTDRSWYPHSFLAPLNANVTHLEASLLYLDSVMYQISEAGIRSDAVTVAGFSQGRHLLPSSSVAAACAARH